MAEQKNNEVTEPVNETEEKLETAGTPEAAEPEKTEPEKTEPEYEPMTLTAEEVKALKEKLTKLQEDRDDAIRQAQRLQAEFENYRKRNATLVADSRDDGIREAVKNMLPVLDNFERALETAGDDPFAQGVGNIRKQFVEALKKCGAEEIPTDGKFDPKLHDAVMQDSVEDKESGDITAVLQKGWKVKGKIVRYSMVKVNN
ncbi:MAG: nucleotide exchange factor GrpE [Clostridiales bacterium]|nr:nucleotide exchange factor GrpE [Clostridiales bacterium]